MKGSVQPLKKLNENCKPFYIAQSAESIWGRTKLLPDVAAVLAALFAPEHRRDVALLVRMTLPQQLPATLEDSDVHVVAKGDEVTVSFLRNEPFFLCLGRAFDFTRTAEKVPPMAPNFRARQKSQGEVLAYMCKPERKPCLELLGVGILPPKEILVSENAERALALAGVSGSLDVYQVALQELHSASASVEAHFQEVFRSLPRDAPNFSFLKLLIRAVPELLRKLVVLSDCGSNRKFEKEWWIREGKYGLYGHDETIVAICGWGGADHVEILRKLFKEVPELRISSVELQAAFDNVSFSGSHERQPDPFLRLICEELPHSPPTVLTDCGHCLLFQVAVGLNADLHSVQKQWMPPRDSAKEARDQQVFAGRVRYLVRDVKVKPDATTLLPILPKDRELFDELVTEHNALRNNLDDPEVVQAFWEVFLHVSLDDASRSKLFPESATLPSLAVVSGHVHSALCRRIAELFSLPVTTRDTRLRRMKTYVQIQLDDEFDTCIQNPRINRSIYDSLPNRIRTVDVVNILVECSHQPPNWNRDFHDAHRDSPPRRLLNVLHDKGIATDVIDALVDTGLDLNHKNAKGSTILHTLALNDNAKLFVHLVEKYKMDPMQENDMKHSAWSLIPNKHGEIYRAQKHGKLPSLDANGRRKDLPPRSAKPRRSAALPERSSASPEVAATAATSASPTAKKSSPQSSSPTTTSPGRKSGSAGQRSSTETSPAVKRPAWGGGGFPTTNSHAPDAASLRKNRGAQVLGAVCTGGSAQPTTGTQPTKKSSPVHGVKTVQRPGFGAKSSS